MFAAATHHCMHGQAVDVPWLARRQGRSAEALRAWQAPQQQRVLLQLWLAGAPWQWQTPPCAFLEAAPSSPSAPHPPMRQTCPTSQKESWPCMHAHQKTSRRVSWQPVDACTCSGHWDEKEEYHEMVVISLGSTLTWAAVSLHSQWATQCRIQHSLWPQPPPLMRR